MSSSSCTLTQLHYPLFGSLCVNSIFLCTSTSFYFATLSLPVLFLLIHRQICLLSHHFKKYFKATQRNPFLTQTHLHTQTRCDKLRAQQTQTPTIRMHASLLRRAVRGSSRNNDVSNSSGSRTTRAVLLALMMIAASLLLFSTVDATIIAIDMGTEFLKIAAPRDSSIEVCLNEQSHRKSDTWIGFRGEERFFGSDAKNLAARFPDAMIPAVPRLVGVAHDDALQRNWLTPMRYTFRTTSSGSERGTVNVTFPASEGAAERHYTSDELMGMLFGYAKTQAEREIGGPVRDAVLVVPRGANSRQRQAMIDAAAITGLRVLAFIHPTTAAALQLGLQNRGLGDEPQHVLIYDMGSAKTEAAVYRFDPIVAASTAAGTTKRPANSFGSISLVGTIASDMTLGGRAIDACLAQYIENTYMATAPTSGKRRVLAGETPQDRKAVMSMLRAANKAKEMLSANREAPVTVEGIAPETDFSLKITRATLERECSSLWERAVAIRDAALLSANISLAQLSRFEVVGGGLRVPILIDKLSEGYRTASSSSVVDRTLNSDEAMVVGAGYFGAALSGHFRIKGFRLVERLGFPVWVTVSLNESISNNIQSSTEQQPPRRKLLLSSETRLPTRLRVRVNDTTTDFNLTLEENAVQLRTAGKAPSTTGGSSTTTTSVTTVTGVLAALQQVGFGDADAAARNITHTVWVDVRASEGGMVYVEKAEIEIHYFVNASRKVRKLVTPENETAAPLTEGDQQGDAKQQQEATDELSGGDDTSDDVTDDVPAAPARDDASKPSSASDDAKARAPTAAAATKKPKFVTVTEVHVEARIRTFPLAVATAFLPPAAPMTRNESIISRDLLRRWRRSDTLQLQKSAARNDLEAYLIWALSDGFIYSDDAMKVVGSQDMDVAAGKLREIQDWLEDAGSEATVETEDLQQKLRHAKLVVRTALRETDTTVADESNATSASSASPPSGATEDDVFDADEGAEDSNDEL